MVQPDRPEKIIRHMRIVRPISKATDIHSEQYYEILIAFPRQQCLRERFSMLRYTCTACLVNICQQLASLTVEARRAPETGHIYEGSTEEITEI